MFWLIASHKKTLTTASFYTVKPIVITLEITTVCFDKQSSYSHIVSSTAFNKPFIPLVMADLVDLNWH